MKSKILKNTTLAKIILSVICVFTIFALNSNSAHAISNTTTLNFQARLLTAAGAVVPDGSYNVDFKIYNTSTPTAGTVGTCTSPCLWEETYAYSGYSGGTTSIGPQVTVKNGYISVNLGAYSTFATYSLTNWSQQLYLSMNIGGTTNSGAITWDGEMGNGGPLSGSHSLLALTAVPVAFSANQLSTNNTGGQQILQFASGTSAATISLPDVAGNVVIAQSGTPVAASGNTGITGYSSANNFVAVAGADALDTATAGALDIGSTTATSIVLGTNTLVNHTSTTALQIQNASGSDSLNVNTSNASVNLDQILPPGTVTAMLAPTISATTTSGTAVTTHYTYEVVAENANGSFTYPSPTNTLTTGNAVLSTSNYNIVSWGAVTGSTYYYVYRTASGGTPSSTGLIGIVATGTTTLHDTGLVATGTAPALTGGLSSTSTAYYFKVTSIDGTGGQTIASSETSSTTETTTTNNAINLSWAPITGARGYNVYYATSPGGETNGYFTTYTNSYQFTTTSGTTAGSIPTTSNAFNDTLSTSGNSQITLGNTTASSSTAQLDVAGYTPLSYTGTISGLGESYGVYTQGNYAYMVNASNNSLQIIDVSNPANPINVSTLGVAADPSSVYVQGRYAYIAGESSGILDIVDVSNPVSPVIVGSQAVTGTLTDVFVQGRYVYVTNQTTSTLQIIDVSNPASPYIVGTSAAILNAPVGVYVQGHYAYVTNDYGDSMEILDISNPSSPVGSGYVVTGTGTNATYPGGPAYIQGDYAYVTTTASNTLVVVNISNPQDPYVVGTSATTGLSAPTTVFVQGRYAYVTNSGGGTLQTFDVSNPASPLSVGSVTSGVGANDLFIQGRYAYVAAWAPNSYAGSLTIFDLGGAYIQQLQAGGAEVGTLTVDTNATVGGNESITGSLGVSSSLDVSGSASVGNLTVTGTAAPSTPSAPTVTPTGTTGSTSYSYAIVAVDSSAQSASSTATQTTTGYATLSTSNYNAITWTAVTGGVTAYNIYRTATTSVSTSSTGLIGTVNGNVLNFNDTGIVANGVSAPTVSAVGTVVLNTNTSAGSVNMDQLLPPGTVTTVSPPVISGITTTGSTSTDSYSYEVVAAVANGATTNPSSTDTITTGYTTLSTSNYNTITWGAVTGATNYYVYRTASGGLPSSTGLIGVVPSGTTTLSDKGLTATGTVPSQYGSITDNATYYFKVTALDGTGGQTVPATEVNQGTGGVGPTTTTSDSYSSPTLTIGYASNSSWVGQAGQQVTLTNFSPSSLDGTWTIKTATATSMTINVPGGATPTSQGTASLEYSGINLSWAPVTGARGYNVYYGTSSGSEANYFTTYTNSYNFYTTSGSTAGTPPTVSTAYNDTLSTTGNSQITLGNTTGSASTAQLDVAGNIPTSAVGTITTGNTPDSVYVQGSYAYVTGQYSNSFDIINISNPANPVLVGTVATVANAFSVYVQGSYAYVLSAYDFQVINISNPANPVVVSTVTALNGGAQSSVYVQGNYAYLTNNAVNTLQIINISNPASPTTVGSVYTGSQPISVYVQGNYAYVTNYGSPSFQVINISNPANPVVVSTVTIGSNPSSVYVQGNYAYVTDQYTDILQIINISNPSSPVVVGNVTTGSNLLSVYVQGNYAYVTSNSSSTLQIINISNPANPIYVSSITTALQPFSVYVQGRYAYVTSYGSASLQIFDLGGAYIQQLQAGGTETGTLTVDTNAIVGGSESISGSLGVASSLNVSGTASLGNLSVSGVAGPSTPSAPTVTPVGTTGYTSYTYAVVALDGSGQSAVSTATQTTTGNSTLTSSNYNTISWSSVSSATAYNIYRTASSGTPSSTGLIGQVSGNTTTFNDTGLAGNSTSAPSVASVGTVVLNTNTSAGSVNLDQLLAPGTVTATLSPQIATTTETGGTGTNYTYEVVAAVANGALSYPSSTNTISGPGTLTASAYNTISWSAVTGATNYYVYRTASGGTPGTTGLIGVVPSGTTTLKDTGLTGNGTSPSVTNALIPNTLYYFEVTAIDGTGGQTVASSETSLSSGGVGPTSTTSGSETGTVLTLNYASNSAWANEKGSQVTLSGYSMNTGSVNGTWTILTASATSMTVSITGGVTSSITAEGTASVVNSINLSWAPVTGARGYNVYYATTSGSESNYLTTYTNSYNFNNNNSVYISQSGSETGTALTLNFPTAIPSSWVTGQTLTLSGFAMSAGSVNGTWTIASTTSNSVVLTITGGVTSTISTEGSVTALVPGTPPVVSTAYNNTLSTTGNSQITLGNATGSASSAQLDVAGNVPTSAISTTSFGLLTSVNVQGNYAYVGNWTNSTLQIINISNPASPLIVGSVYTGSDPDSVYVQGNYAYVVDQYGNNFVIVNISNPASPETISTITTGSGPNSVYVQGNYAYVATNVNLQIINISNPASPLIVGTVTTSSDLASVYVQGNYAYVNNAGNSSVQIINITNPAIPIIVGTLSIAAASYSSIYVQGNYAYLAGGGSSITLQIINVSNPNTPTLVSTINTGAANPQGVYVQGNYAYVLNEYSNSIQIFNVSNPNTPTLVGTVATAFSPQSVYVQGRYAYVASAGGTGNFQIFDLGGAYIQQLQAGGTETGTLTVDTNAIVGGSESISGSLGVASSLNVSGTASLGNLSVSGVAGPSTPSAPTVTPVGTTGYTSYTYAVVALDGSGQSAVSTATQTTTGNSTLTSSNYNTISWSSVSSATAYNIYRTASSGTPSSTGLIGQVSGNTTTFNDTGLAGNSTSAPSVASVGTVVLNTNTSAGSVNLDQLLAPGTVTATLPPTISNITAFGSTNNTSYTYEAVAVTANGALTYPGSTDTITNAYSVLSASNYNIISLPYYGSNMYLYRTASGGTAGTTGSTTGLIAILPGGTTTFDDTGLPATATAPSQAGYLINNGVYYYFKVTALDGTGGQTVASNEINQGTGGVGPTLTTSGSYTGSTLTLNYSSTSGWVGQAGQQVELSGYSPSSLNGTWTIITATATSMTVNVPGGATPTVQGTASSELDGINLSWAPVTGARAYNVYFGTSSGSESDYFTTNTNSFNFSNGLYTPTSGSETGTALTLNFGLVPSSWAVGQTLTLAGFTMNTGSVNGAWTIASLTSTSVVLTITGGITSTISTEGTVTAATAGTPPTISNAYNSTLSTTGNSQITLGNTTGSASSAQLDVAGNLSTSALSTIALGSGALFPYVEGNYAYVVNNNALQIIDISNPAIPVIVGSVPSGVGSVYVQGNYAYVAGANALQVVNVSNPSDPVIVGSVGSWQASYVYVQGRYAYVAEQYQSLVQVIDISNPSNPLIVGSISTDYSGSINYPDDIYVQGSYAYISGHGNSVFQVVNVSNPANPVTVAYDTNVGADPQSVFVQGSYAYVIDQYNGLQVFNVSNPSNPVSLGISSTYYGASSIYIQGHYGYIVNNFNNTLQTVDISNPANPVNVATVSTAASPQAVYIQGRYAYVVNQSSSSLQIFDLGGAYIQQLQAGGTETGTLTVDTNAYVGGNESISGSLGVTSSLNVSGSADLGSLTVSGVAGPSTPSAPTVTPTGTTGSTSYSYAIVALNASGQSAASTATQTTTGSVDLGSFSSQTASTTTFATPYLTYDVPSGQPFVTGMSITVSSCSNSNDNGTRTITSYTTSTIVVNDTSGVASVTGCIIASQNDYNNISWSAVSIATAYNIYRTASSGTQNSTGLIGQVNGNTLTFNDVGLTANNASAPSTASAGTIVLNTNTSTASVNLDQLLAPGTVTTVSPPVISGITTTGSTSTDSYSYEVVAAVANGATTNPSSTDTITTGYTTLSTSNYNTITWGAVTGATNYYVYRTASGGLPSSTGLIGVVPSGTTTLSDKGLTATGTVPSQYGSITDNATYYFEVTAIDGTGGQTVPATEVNQGTGGVGPTTTTSDSYSSPTLTIGYASNSSWVGQAGQQVTLTNFSPSSLDGTWTIKTATATSMTINVPGGATPTSQGTASLEYSGINLSWAPVTGARGYNVYYGTSSGSEANYFTTYTNSYNFYTTSGSTAGTPPTVSTAYNDTLSTTGNSQITLGNTTGSASTAQLDVAGNIPSSAISTTNLGVGNTLNYVYVQGSYAYVTNYGSGTLQVINISNPSNPTIVGTVGSLSNPQNVYVQGSYAYVANYGNNTLQVINISNPSNPTIVGTVTTAANAYSVYVQGDYAYVGDIGANSLQIINISNPANPIITSTVTTAGAVNSVQIEGNYAIATVGSAIQAINISNPASPAVVGSVSTGSNTYSIYVQGNYAYVTDSSGLQIINITNPTSMAVVSTFTVGSTPEPVFVEGNYAYIGNYVSNTFQVVDISNPTNPISIGTVSSGISGPHSIYVQGRYAFLANQSNGNFQIFDVGGAYVQQLQAGGIETGTLDVDASANITGNESITGGLSVSSGAEISGNVGINGNIDVGNTGSTISPVSQLYVGGSIPTASLGSISTVGSNYGRTTYVSGNYAYVGTTKGLQIFNVSNPASPVSIGNIAAGATNCIYMQDHYIYAVNYGSAGNGSLYVIDVSNPSNPVLISTTTNSALYESYNIYISGNYLYDAVGNTPGTVLTFNISNPYNPIQISSIDLGAPSSLSSDFNAIYVQGNYAYVTAYGTNYGLYVINIANPYTPFQVGYTATENVPIYVYVSGNYAYVGQTQSLQIFDISDPSNPVNVGSNYANTPYVGDIYVQGRYAYIQGNSTIQVMDVSSPSNPQVVGTIPVNGTVNSIFVQGRYLYVASSTSLQIFDVGGSYVQQLQAGGADVGTLTVDNNAQINGNASVAGSVAVASSLQVAGNATLGGLSISGLANLTPPTVAVIGTAQTTQVTYAISAFNQSGQTTAESTQITTSNANLSTTNYNAITWNGITNAQGYYVYRTATNGTSPSSTNIGLIGTISNGTDIPTGGSESGTTLTLTFPTATPFVVGEGVTMSGFTSSPTLATGTWIVMTITSGTSITFYNSAGATITSFSAYGTVSTTTAFYDINIAANTEYTAPTVSTAGTISINTTSNFAFQVNNAAGEPVFLVGTDPQGNNLLTYSGFEAGSFTNATTGWVESGSTGTIAQNSVLADTYNGLYSLKMVTSSGNAGAQTQAFVQNVTPGTYVVSFYVLPSVTMNANKFTITLNNGSSSTCSPASSSNLSITSFTRVYCSLSIATNNLTYLTIAQNDSVARTIYIDAVQLQLGTLPTAYEIGTVQIRGIIANPLSVQTPSNSSTEFQVLNASAVNLLTVDSNVGQVVIGSGSTGDSTGYVLTLDSKTGSITDPTYIQGAMYYNATSGTFRCGEGPSSTYQDCAVGFDYANTATASVNGNTTGIQLLSSAATMPANYCTSGRDVEILANGIYSTTTTAQPIAFNIELGTTTVGVTSTAFTPGVSLTNAAWTLQFQVICNAAPGASVAVTGEGYATIFPAASTNTAALEVIPMETTTTTTTSGIATNGTLAVKLGVTFTGTASASNTIQVNQFIAKGE